MKKKIIHKCLIIWCKRHKYSQGDDYYTGCTKKGDWYVGYSNDYPLQHGEGKKFILTQEEFNQAMEN